MEANIDSVVEGDEVVFTCSGNVGGQHAGQLQWYYYLSGQSVARLLEDGQPGVSIVQGEIQPVSGDCSYTRTSVLRLTMQKSFDGFLVRCTVQQDIYTPEGEDHIQTDNIAVMCKYYKQCLF